MSDAQPLATSPVVDLGLSANKEQGLISPAASADVAREIATIHQMFAVARQFPRDESRAQEQILKTCERPRFAAKATWTLSRWDGREQREVDFTGPSIRFAEEMFRVWRNMFFQSRIVAETESHRAVHITAIDLESALAHSREIVVAKRMERLKLKKGQQALDSRRNSNGQVVYVVEATEDDVLQRQQALVSKAIRTEGLRLIPDYLVEECLDKIEASAVAQISEEVKRRQESMLKAFEELGVTREQLESRLGCAIEEATAPKINLMEGVYRAIRDGQRDVDEVFKDHGFGAKTGTEQMVDEIDKQKSTKKGKKKAASGKKKPSEEEGKEPDAAPPGEEKPKGPDKLSTLCKEHGIDAASLATIAAEALGDKIDPGELAMMPPDDREKVAEFIQKKLEE